MSPFHKAFEAMHTDSDEWIRLQELLREARGDLPKSNYLPTLPPFGDRPRSEVIEETYRASFHPVSAEVAEAFAARLLDGSWPDGLSDVHSYWIGVTLTLAERTIWTIAPTSNESLTPTIIPFPDHDFRQVALWFCTEWWAIKGGRLHLSEIKRRNEEA